MIKISKREIKKIIISLKKLPRNLAENAFLTFLGLLFISIIFGGFIFYQYRLLAESPVEISEEEEELRFEKETYLTILTEWQERNKQFLEAELKEYSNPFRVD